MEKNKIELLKEYLENLDESELLNIWNEYARECDFDNIIYTIDEFNDVCEGQDADWVANRIYYGNFNPTYDYFIFNGYGNFESFFDITDNIYFDDLANYIIDNDEDFNDSEIREILDNENLDDEE